MTDETRILAAYVAGVSYDSLPRAVTKRAQHLLIDLVGSILRARMDSESTASVLRMLSVLALDMPGKCFVPGDVRGYTPAVAALLNGALGHSLDFDDTHADSSLHPSAPVIPAALAVGQLLDASGRDVLAAIVAGYEVCCRIGMALDPTAHYARGFHPTATAGVFGAAAAAARLYKLNSEEIVSAFGVAASQAAGSLQFLENGAWNKRYQVGAAAMNGVIAATLARSGFRGASRSIEGKHGFLQGYSDQPRLDRAIADLGRTYETMRIGVKPYPGCRYTHAALDGLIALRRRFDPTQLRAVTIGLHQNGVRLTGAPLEDKRRPRSIVDAQFSMPFSAAVAIATGRFGWDDYGLLDDPQIASIARGVTVERDTRVEQGSTHPFGAIVSVRTASEDIELIITDPSGEPSSFPDEAQIREKFLALGRPVLGDGAATLFELLSHLDEPQPMSLNEKLMSLTIK